MKRILILSLIASFTFSLTACKTDETKPVSGVTHHEPRSSYNTDQMQ